MYTEPWVTASNKKNYLKLVTSPKKTNQRQNTKKNLDIVWITYNVNKSFDGNFNFNRK